MLLPRVQIKQEWVQKIGKRGKLVPYLSARLLLVFRLAYHPCPPPASPRLFQERGKKDLDLENRVEKTGVTKVAGLESPDNRDPSNQRLWVYWRGRNWEKIQKGTQNWMWHSIYHAPKKCLHMCCVRELVFFSFPKEVWELVSVRQRSRNRNNGTTKVPLK